MRDSTEQERGATSVEYAIMVAGIAIVIFAATAAFGLAVNDLFIADWPWN